MKLASGQLILVEWRSLSVNITDMNVAVISPRSRSSGGGRRNRCQLARDWSRSSCPRLGRRRSTRIQRGASFINQNRPGNKKKKNIPSLRIKVCNDSKNKSSDLFNLIDALPHLSSRLGAAWSSGPRRPGKFRHAEIDVYIENDRSPSEVCVCV